MATAKKPVPTLVISITGGKYKFHLRNLTQEQWDRVMDELILRFEGRGLLPPGRVDRGNLRTLKTGATNKTLGRSVERVLKQMFFDDL
jgi:hypothetical protein